MPLTLAAMVAGFRLGIDFGTSHTAAMLQWPDGRVRPLLFDGSPLLPSAVFVDPGGFTVVGRDAWHAARADPARFEPTPKRRVDETTVLLGDREIPVRDLVAAVLGTVAAEAGRVTGHQPVSLTLTHPGNWSVSRKLVLTEAAARAGLPEPRLAPEPVAAATYFVEVLGRQLGPQQALVVYDFGAGTFDVSVVERDGDGYRVLAVDGLDDVGGLDLDAMIVGRLAEQRTGDPDWQRLLSPQSVEERRAHRQLWDDARAAKEMLSRSTSTNLTALGTTIRLTRDEFDQFARPLLERTVRTTEAAIRWTKLPPEQIAGIFLVGGSSRIPLIADLITDQLGIQPVTIEQPELVVAEGSLRATATAADEATAVLPSRAPQPALVQRPPEPERQYDTTAEQAHLPPPQPQPHQPQPPQPQPHQWRPRRRRRWPAAVAGALAVVLVGAAIGYAIQKLGRPTGEPPGGSGTPSAGRFQRVDPPAWLPADWRQVIDDNAQPYFREGSTSTGGDCVREGNLVRARTPLGIVSGCVTPNEAYTDVAVEVELTVLRGCGVIWVRTGNRGYLLRVCEGGAFLHRLGSEGASPQNTVGDWDLPRRPEGLVVGMSAIGLAITVYADGVQIGQFIDEASSAIPRGKVNVGVFPEEANGAEATYAGFKAWSA